MQTYVKSDDEGSEGESASIRRSISLIGRSAGSHERDYDADERFAQENISIWTLILSKHFLMIYAMSASELFYALYFDIVFKELGQHYIEADETLTRIGSMGYLANMVGRLVGGFMLDYYDPIKVNHVILSVFLITMVTLHWSIQQVGTYMLTTVAVMGCEGAFVALQAVVVM